MGKLFFAYLKFSYDTILTTCVVIFELVDDIPVLYIGVVSYPSLTLSFPALYWFPHPRSPHRPGID